MRFLVLFLIPLLCACDGQPAKPPAATLTAEAPSEPAVQGYGWKVGKNIRLSVGESWVETLPRALSGRPQRLKWVVTLENTSAVPVWVVGHAAESPLYTLFTRPTPDDPWVDRGPGWCGVGVDAHLITPGVSHSFPVYLPGDLRGQQFIVSISYRTAQPAPYWSSVEYLVAQSDPSIIRE